MMNGTPGLSALADAVEKLNARIDSMGSRMDAAMTRADVDHRSSGYELASAGAACKSKKEVLEKARNAGLDKEQTQIMLGGFTSKDERGDATKEVHEFYASHAKKTAQKAIDGGDPKLAAKWVDYGTSHSKQAEDKAEKLEGPPEDKKKADKKK